MSDRFWLVSVVAVAALVWALVAVGAHGGLLSGQRHGVHFGHPLVSSLGGEFAANVDHPHVVDGSRHSHHPEQFAAAVLPQRAGAALVVLGLVVAVVAVAGVAGAVVMPVGRGPPWGLAGVVAGRDLLTRFCLLRR